MSNCRLVGIIALVLAALGAVVLACSHLWRYSREIAGETASKRYCHATRMLMNTEVNSVVKGSPETFQQVFLNKSPTQLQDFRPCPSGGNYMFSFTQKGGLLDDAVICTYSNCVVGWKHSGGLKFGFTTNVFTHDGVSHVLQRN